MNYRDPELLDRLAAEYVLGTLHGRARRRFERLMATSPALREQVDAWQDRLAPLADQLTAVTPPGRVWRRLQGRLWGRSAGASAGWLWRGWALTASLLLAVVLVVQWPFPEVPAPQPEVVVSDRIAVLRDEEGAVLWTVHADPVRGQLSMRTPDGVPVEADHVHELWLIPPDQDPVSLGVLPAEGRLQVSMAPRIVELLMRSEALAVSVEPPGGSPTGLPTGPVVLQADLLNT